MQQYLEKSFPKDTTLGERELDVMAYQVNGRVAWSLHLT